jgi:hypothetical protein
MYYQAFLFISKTFIRTEITALATECFLKEVYKVQTFLGELSSDHTMPNAAMYSVKELS